MSYRSAIVTGGSGFLGSHVADSLSKNGYDVTIFDLKPSPYLTSTQKMVVGDILCEDQILEAFQGIDVVYHFAGLADLDDASTKPIDTVQKNVVGIVTVLDAALRAGVKRFVYGSTIYVYSQLGGFYRCSKQAGELYVEEYQRCYGLNFTILRYGTLYGPRANITNSVYRYLYEGLVNQKIEFSGSKDDVREYVHVRDAANLSVEILSENFQDQRVIITGHHQIKVQDLLNMISEILKHDVALEYTEAKNSSHYTLTPYSFIPKIGNKLIGNSYVDMGQGLLECLHEIYSAQEGKVSQVAKKDPIVG